MTTILRLRFALMGAIFHIAKDLVKTFAAKSSHEVVLYSRRPDVV